MCGFAGFVGPCNPELLRRMGESVKHRGPDQDGVFESEECSLIHKRLSIIDLSEAGRQPMTTLDDRFVVAYNGEIYNYRELRKRYQDEGWSFHTQTDTECLLASVALHGLQDLADFHGMFAFALWDKKEKACFLARDRMGIKPLYISCQSEAVYFASEIPALLHVRTKWRIDEEARTAYLAVGYIPGPKTIFQGIESLEPGKLFKVENGAVNVHSSFTIPHSSFSHRLSRSEARERLVKIVDSAVASQLVSDRPVGVFLSGGMDSSVVLSSMRLARPSAIIKTFTTRFRHDSADLKFNRDAELAALTAARYGCEHHEIEVGPEDVMRETGEMAKRLGQPHANNSTVALDAVARYAAKEVTVGLSGDGGDESFGGYDRYLYAARLAPLFRSFFKPFFHLHPRLAKWLQGLSAADDAGVWLSFHSVPLSMRKKLFCSPNDEMLLKAWRERLVSLPYKDKTARLMALDRATWLKDDAFVRSDRLTMRHGLELRVPLTDDSVVDFAASLPRSWHVDFFKTKKLWRKAFHNRCVKEVFNEPKRGWFPPHAKWLRAGLKDWTCDMLEEAISTHSWINGDELRRFFNDHLESRGYHLQEIWTVVGYHAWWREYRDHLEGV